MKTAESLLKELPATFPVELELGGAKYQIHSVLRFLAGRRIVLHASNDSGEFVLKLFAAQGKGQQEYQRELKAHQHCSQADIAVAPRIVARKAGFGRDQAFNDDLGVGRHVHVDGLAWH